MRGGDRNKQTSLLHNCSELRQLELRCDGSHSHKSWSVSKSLDGRWKYDTASEAEYPPVLCQRIAVIVSKLAHALQLPAAQPGARAAPLAAVSGKLPQDDNPGAGVRFRFSPKTDSK